MSRMHCGTTEITIQRWVDQVCPACHGSGERSYSSTATWRGGIGGQAITSDVCDKCWGSGDIANPWTDLRKQLGGERQRIAEGALTRLASAAGCDLGGMEDAVNELCTELDRFASPRARKVRPRWFAECCISLAKTLRKGLEKSE